MDGTGISTPSTLYYMEYLPRRKRNEIIYEDAVLEEKVVAVHRIALIYPVEEDLEVSVGEIKISFTP